MALTAARRKYVVFTPGISTGYESQEDSFVGALFRRHLQQVFPLVQYSAGGESFFAAGQDLRQRAFARAVRLDDGVDFAGVPVRSIPFRISCPPSWREDSEFQYGSPFGFTRRFLRDSH